MEVDGVSYDVWSLSARRAWIEIVITAMTSQISVVALRKESVDRNFEDERAYKAKLVALRKESVDRNLCNQVLRVFACRRSPQGERG